MANTTSVIRTICADDYRNIPAALRLPSNPEDRFDFSITKHMLRQEMLTEESGTSNYEVEHSLS
jgi:hypothetical protein